MISLAMATPSSTVVTMANRKQYRVVVATENAYSVTIEHGRACRGTVTFDGYGVAVEPYGDDTTVDLSEAASGTGTLGISPRMS